MNKKEAIAKAVASLDPSAILCDLNDSEFETGGAITNACREAGYDESGRITVNQLSAWNKTVSEFADMIASPAFFLRVNSITYGNGYADVSFCEATEEGDEDAHENDRLTFDMAATREEAERDIHQQLERIAENRGLELEFSRD